MSYLVMECHPGYAVLLDEEGRFLKAANLRYEIGQRVYDPVLMKETPQKHRHAVRWISSGIAAIAACLLLFFGFGYYQNFIQPYSSIYLSINPEVQMNLNRQGTVVELIGANEDGKKLLEGYSGKGKDKVTVADELIDRAIEMGFLSEGGRVSFSIDSPDDALFQEYGAELRTKVTEHLDGRIAITIEIVNHRNGREEENAEPAFSPTSSPPASSQTASPMPSSPGPSQPPIAPPASSGSTDYGNTDYGPGDDGVTDYAPPASSAPVHADTDYGPDSDGITNYTDGNTDYDPDNNAHSDSDDNGESGYDDDDKGNDSDDSDDGDD